MDAIRSLETATKYVMEKGRRYKRQTPTGKEKEEQICRYHNFSWDELKYKDAKSTESTMKYKSFVIHAS